MQNVESCPLFLANIAVAILRANVGEGLKVLNLAVGSEWETKM
jgi:hypothetical protein